MSVLTDHAFRGWGRSIEGETIISRAEGGAGISIIFAGRYPPIQREILFAFLTLVAVSLGHVDKAILNITSLRAPRRV